MGAEYKSTAVKGTDLITILGAMENLYLDQPENVFKCQLALTRAQQLITSRRRWRWLTSSGSFAYSANNDTYNLASVSSGKYRAMNTINWMRVSDTWRLKEITEDRYNTLKIGASTADRPQYLLRRGADGRTILFWPKPTTADSVYFSFDKKAGFIWGNGDIILPEQFHLNVLLPLAQRYLWKIDDPRRQIPNPELSQAVEAMLLHDEGGMALQPDFGKWNPIQPAREWDDELSTGFYSSGNLPW